MMGSFRVSSGRPSLLRQAALDGMRSLAILLAGVALACALFPRVRAPLSEAASELEAGARDILAASPSDPPTIRASRIPSVRMEVTCFDAGLPELHILKPGRLIVCETVVVARTAFEADPRFALRLDCPVFIDRPVLPLVVLDID